jgi:hypothetical protein
MKNIERPLQKNMMSLLHFFWMICLIKTKDKKEKQLRVRQNWLLLQSVVIIKNWSVQKKDVKKHFVKLFDQLYELYWVIVVILQSLQLWYCVRTQILDKTKLWNILQIRWRRWEKIKNCHSWSQFRGWMNETNNSIHSSLEMIKILQFVLLHTDTHTHTKSVV